MPNSEPFVPNSSPSAGLELQLNPGSVSAVVRGKRHHTGGYEFKLAPSPDLPGEIWKALTVNTKTIQVSSLGRFLDTRGLKKSPVPSRSGYCSVGINGKTYRVHRLVVCEAFWGPPPLGLEVNHKDRNQSNNHYTNLEWVTSRYNTLHSYETNKNRRSNAAKRSKPVYGRKHKTEDEWVEYASMSEAARQLLYFPGHQRKATPNRRLRVQAETARVIFFVVVIFCSIPS